MNPSQGQSAQISHTPDATKTVAPIKGFYAQAVEPFTVLLDGVHPLTDCTSADQARQIARALRLVNPEPTALGMSFIAPFVVYVGLNEVGRFPSEEEAQGFFHALRSAIKAMREVQA